MNKLLFILFSFPIVYKYSDPEEIGLILESIASMILTFFIVYYLYRLYKDSFNPWLRFLGLFGLIIVSIFFLLALLIIIDGGL